QLVGVEAHQSRALLTRGDPHTLCRVGLLLQCWGQTDYLRIGGNADVHALLAVIDPELRAIAERGENVKRIRIAPLSEQALDNPQQGALSAVVRADESVQRRERTVNVLETGVSRDFQLG